MTFQNFEDIQAWQHSIELGAIIYATFSELKDFGIRFAVQSFLFQIILQRVSNVEITERLNRFSDMP